MCEKKRQPLNPEPFNSYTAIYASLSSATATYLIIGDHGQITGDEIFHYRTDIRSLIVMVDIDACLTESHERPHADTAHDQGVDSVFRQQIHRHHAAALDVGLIVDGGDLFDASVFHVHQGKCVTMAKMTGPLAVEASRFYRRNGDSSFFHIDHFLLSVVIV